jgi:hypothetical protein
MWQGIIFLIFLDGTISVPYGPPYLFDTYEECKAEGKEVGPMLMFDHNAIAFTSECVHASTNDV